MSKRGERKRAKKKRKQKESIVLKVDTYSTEFEQTAFEQVKYKGPFWKIKVSYHVTHPFLSITKIERNYCRGVFTALEAQRLFNIDIDKEIQQLRDNDYVIKQVLRDTIRKV